MKNLFVYIHICIWANVFLHITIVISQTWYQVLELKQTSLENEKALIIQRAVRRLSAQCQACADEKLVRRMYEDYDDKAPANSDYGMVFKGAEGSGWVNLVCVTCEF